MQNTITQTITATTDTTASNVVSNDKSKQVAHITAAIENLVAQREQWQQNAFRTSNDQLYSLLQSCYSLYKSMEGTDTGAKAMRDQLKAYIDSKGYTFKKTTHTIAKLIKCVFGVEDRRRISTYTLVLRSALARKTGVLEVVNFIRDEGGIEEIRLAKSPTALSTKQKAQVASNSVSARSLASVSSDALGTMLDAGKVGSNTLLIGTWQADGSIVVRAVVNSDTAMNAALASQYSVIKASEKEQAAANDAAIISNAKKQAIAAAVASATVTA
jgi:hypothetical protein